MKLPAYSRYDSLLQAVTLPLVIGLLAWILIGPPYWQNWLTFGLATGITGVILFINWLNNNLIALQIRRRFPAPDQYRKRITRQILLTTISSSSHAVLIFGIFAFIHLPYFDVDFSRLGLVYCLPLPA